MASAPVVEHLLKMRDEPGRTRGSSGEKPPTGRVCRALHRAKRVECHVECVTRTRCERNREAKNTRATGLGNFGAPPKPTLVSRKLRQSVCTPVQELRVQIAGGAGACLRHLE